MTKITSIDLYKAKEKCLKLQENNNRLVLKGTKPILLTTTILKNNSTNKSNMFELYPISAYNSISSSYLDSLILYLNENYGINGIIDYLEVEDNLSKVVDQLSIKRRYSDDTTRKLIIEKNIQALFSLKIDKTTSEEQVELVEKMSSYSFMGLTSITTELSKMLNKNNLQNHMEYGDSFSSDYFENQGYDFTDDTIAYNEYFSLGPIKGQQLPKEKIWPRTVEVHITSEDDTYNLERVGDTLIDYFSWIETELQEKGRDNAMSPMSPETKTYKKELVINS